MYICMDFSVRYDTHDSYKFQTWYVLNPSMCITACCTMATCECSAALPFVHYITPRCLDFACVRKIVPQANYATSLTGIWRRWCKNRYDHKYPSKNGSWKHSPSTADLNRFSGKLSIFEMHANKRKTSHNNSQIVKRYIFASFR